MTTAASGYHERRQAPEPPPVYAGLRWNRRRARQHIIAGEHARRTYERADLFCDHTVKLALHHNCERTEFRYGIDS
jgi:hypothetical protein